MPSHISLEGDERRGSCLGISLDLAKFMLSTLIMAEVKSTFTLEKGQQAPAFQLADAQGKNYQSAELFGDNGTLVVFACNHCPFVIMLAKELGEYAQELAELGVNTIAINSNDVANYPQDSPAKMVEFAVQNGWNFPYLYDESQNVAHAYAAACTPDFYLFDGDGQLAYAGEFCPARPTNGVDVTASSLRAAVDLMLAGRIDEIKNSFSSGCNIKWKTGNEPVYFTPKR